MCRRCCFISDEGPEVPERDGLRQEVSGGHFEPSVRAEIDSDKMPQKSAEAGWHYDDT